MQVCMACSTTTEETGRFCPSCGAVLASQDAGVATAATAHGETSAAASMLGVVVDGFAIEGVLGGGSFGTVYRGRQLGLDREIAVKIPTAEIAADPVMARRFAREARAAAKVTHPGIVAIYGVGELPDGRPYLAMQLIEGEPLDRILDGGPVPAVRALRIARQIAAALAETHAAGVVHRDLKPSNVMWRSDRLGDDRIVIVDFGIAVAKPGTADAARLTAGGLIGTPHYMSPEQAQGDMVDARADLYALGCLLFELLTGETPFDGSAYEVLLAQLGRPAPAPSSRNPEVPAVADALVLSLMAKKADARPQSADAVVAAIDEALLELDAAAASSSRPAATARPAAPRPGKRATKPARALDGALDGALDADADAGALAAFAARGPRPRSLGPRIRDFATGAAAALLLTAAGFTAYQLAGGAAGGGSNGGAEQPTKRRELPLFEDGDTRLRVWVPDPMRARGQRVYFELRNKLGQIMRSETVIVTVQDPSGKATGLIARPRQSDPDQLGFHFDYKTAGTYHVRVFPPETASAFDVPIEVTP
jgi:RNA polymerase subunit RPABC4/transcription elongation factor Spt4